MSGQKGLIRRIGYTLVNKITGIDGLALLNMFTPARLAYIIDHRTM